MISLTRISHLTSRLLSEYRVRQDQAEAKHKKITYKHSYTKTFSYMMAEMACAIGYFLYILYFYILYILRHIWK